MAVIPTYVVSQRYLAHYEKDDRCEQQCSDRHAGDGVVRAAQDSRDISGNRREQEGAEEQDDGHDDGYDDRRNKYHPDEPAVKVSGL